jgi:hypothetical protein
MTDAATWIRTAAAWLAGHLATGPAARLEAAVALADATMAVREAAGLIDPERRMGAWARAGALEQELWAFEMDAYEHIAAGRRGPRNALEAALLRILACPSCPRSQRRLLELID